MKLNQFCVHRVVEELSTALQTRNALLAQFLPSIDFDDFPGWSREKVLKLISNEQDDASTIPLDEGDNRTSSPGTTTVWGEIDELDHEWDESKREQEYASPVGDDVNGLAVQQGAGSYLGVSSIGAALRVLFVVWPPARQSYLQLRGTLLRSQLDPAQRQLQNYTRPETSKDRSGSFLPSAEQAAVDAYFEHFHAMIPMIDEVWFRSLFQTQFRTDDAWLALLNMVLALGSIAAGDDQTHVIYHSRTQQVIGYNTFSSGNLEVLQALILLGGQYLHYINSPNTAYLVMGTAFRMAIAMALHRDTVGGIQPQNHALENLPSSATNMGRLSRAEIRRRTWWSLVCTDTWAGILLGRPTVTRWDPVTMDIALPNDLLVHADHVSQGDRDWTGTSLRLSAEFAKISSRIEYRLSQFSRLNGREVIAFETQLQAWNKSRPPTFVLGTACPRSIRYSRVNMHYRFHIARLVMSRPHLLRLAENTASSEPLTFVAEDWRAVSICRDAASAIINEASRTHSQNRVSVWHSSWYLFQACMVPLLSIALGRRLPSDQAFDEDMVNSWKESLERAIRTFRAMAPYTRSTDRYMDVVESLYNGIVTNYELEQQATMSNGSAFNDLLVMAGADTGSLSPSNVRDFDLFPSWFDDNLAFGDEGMNWQWSFDQWLLDNLSSQQGG
ncbi:hypothetical protein A1O3_01800 [Capronia epimyces CBS 606.96]|uniref:Xylanolytic transcriptional activator regulatory domain-containing protein n=1 Tax=Capronia epimyces CBS 606.96 TaxID=1182542 RepID=W9YKY9_9EURO|nr:uncharacterized protein A1O3_01800 [Capronia epimyces CBS 606.96]EXJ93243.1 hypothetical protein A1O3_01800 [Capronia epimyces CBS 606.96]